jgi:hypothetical protein
MNGFARAYLLKQVVHQSIKLNFGHHRLSRKVYGTSQRRIWAGKIANQASPLNSIQSSIIVSIISGNELMRQICVDYTSRKSVCIRHYLAFSILPCSDSLFLWFLTVARVTGFSRAKRLSTTWLTLRYSGKWHDLESILFVNQCWRTNTVTTWKESTYLKIFIFRWTEMKIFSFVDSQVVLPILSTSFCDIEFDHNHSACLIGTGSEVCSCRLAISNVLGIRLWYSDVWGSRFWATAANFPEQEYRR